MVESKNAQKTKVELDFDPKDVLNRDTECKFSEVVKLMNYYFYGDYIQDAHDFLSVIRKHLHISILIDQILEEKLLEGKMIGSSG